MHERTRPAAFFAALALALTLPLAAGEPAKGDSPKPKESAKQSETTAVTKRTVTIGGKPIAYTATAGTLILKDDKGEQRASVFYVAYTKDGTKAGSKEAGARPVTFTFNGGPGSSSVWLHLGTFGPRRVAFADAELPPPAPYGFVDNAHSILDATDLVFIDPVGTGFSRALGEAKDEDFWGVKEDVKAVGDFIRLWTTRNDRWQAPKFLAGESYGTTRAAALVNHLQSSEGMTFNGVILVSSILNFQTARFNVGNDLPYITFLPTYAATAWHHDAVAGKPASLEAFLAEARAFASGEYAQALMKGSKLGAAEADAVAVRLAHYTGLSKEFVLRANLRVSIQRFTKELLRSRRLTVGRLDSRYTGFDDDAAGETTDFDPSLAAITGPYTAAMYDYARTELKVADDRKYEVLSGLGGKWKWGDQGSGGGYVNVAEDLRAAMSRNPHLKVLVANGYYDLATPFFASEYTFDHLGLEAPLLGNVTMTYYPAGHMMYVHGPSLAALKTDVAAFIAKATAKP
jgi:carboxypeptidase C (cathepsin A)